MQGSATAARQRAPLNGWVLHNSGTNICFCCNDSLLALFVRSEDVGKATPFLFTNLKKKTINKNRILTFNRN